MRAPEREPRLLVERPWARRALAALAFAGLFLLPFLGWLSAEPTPYRDPQGFFSYTPPEGWAVDDSGHMGPGLVAKGPPDADGAEPLVHLTHESAGIVTLEVRWQTLLGQMRFEMDRVKYLSLEEHPESTPPYAQALFAFQQGQKQFVALTRLVHAGGRFYQVTAAAPEAVFPDLHATFLASFDSLRPAGK